MADSSTRSNPSSSTSTDTSAGTIDGGLIKQLTDAILKLAERPLVPPEPDELVQERRRVDFGYRSLGILMGRDPAQQGFGLPVFSARWSGKGEKSEIQLFDLPDAVTWVEVTAPGFTEPGGGNSKVWPPVRKSLRVVRGSTGPREESAPAAGSATPPPRIAPDKEIFPRRPIDQLIGLEREDGVGVALGPRLAPVLSNANPS